MKNSPFYANYIVSQPFTTSSFQIDGEGRKVVDLVLSNEFATDMQVSQMDLSILKLSAFDEVGKEHTITNFLHGTHVTLHSLSQGQSLRSRSLVSLRCGVYSKLRFYIKDADSFFTYSDASKETPAGFGYLDFEINNGLTITGAVSPIAVLRFDFVPFKSNTFVPRLANVLRSPKKLSGRLAGSFGH
ncbi:hypothetical protein [Euzebyella saccharophila]|uniref:Uncharacterized protein n=1 Tax=Euzebyella saccharophila TaxID=679664 RepID=A0ABV8JSL8_9FLAO|nr:hypothetical protein [Euzebyella saccharophila]